MIIYLAARLLLYHNDTTEIIIMIPSTDKERNKNAIATNNPKSMAPRIVPFTPLQKEEISSNKRESKKKDKRINKAKHNIIAP
jgi:hypothetical protein